MTHTNIHPKPGQQFFPAENRQEEFCNTLNAACGVGVTPRRGGGPARTPIITRASSADIVRMENRREYVPLNGVGVTPRSGGGFTHAPTLDQLSVMRDQQVERNLSQYRYHRVGATLQRRDGFTLIEVTISLAVFSVIMIGIMSLLSNIFTLNRQQGALLSDQDQARKLSFILMNEVRNATVADTGAYPLEAAGAQSITFFSNIDADPDIERVRYFLQNGALYKGVKQPTGSPVSYASSPEVTTLVQANVGSPTTLFRYFDDTYDGVTGAALAQPVSVTAVRFVALDIPITKRAGVVNSQTYTVSAQATIRSLKTNLGDGAPPPAQAPTVDLLANGSNGPLTLAYSGVASLTWSSANASSCSASGSWAGSVGITGSQSTGALTTNQTYTLTCTGPGGSASDTVNVTVQPPPAPTVDVLANGAQGPITITYNTSVTLTWTSTTTTGCTASGSWSGAQATSGSWTSAALTSNQTYTLTCTGPGGSIADSVTVNVTAPPPPQPNCVSAAPQATNAFGNGTFYVYAYGVSNATQVAFFVYKGSSQQLVSGVDLGSGTWQGSVNLANISSKGWYTVEVLLTNAGYTDVLCATTQFRRR